jgi:hypothetical protein
MNKLTGEEILDKLKKSGLPLSVFAHDDPDYGDGEWIYDPETGEEREMTSEEAEELYNKAKEELGGWDEVAQKGGEGQGDEWYSVKFFPKYDIYIKTDGWYSSYHGVDFEEWGKEVTPKEKVITVYE